MIGVLGHVIKSILRLEPTHIAIPAGTVYFVDENFSKRVPVFVHYPTKVGLEIKTNAWLVSKRHIARKATKLAKSIEASDSIDKIKIGQFASGLLRIATESQRTPIVTIGMHYFERTELELETPVGILRFNSFQCLAKAY